MSGLGHDGYLFIKDCERNGVIFEDLGRSKLPKRLAGVDSKLAASLLKLLKGHLGKKIFNRIHEYDKNDEELKRYNIKSISENNIDNAQSFRKAPSLYSVPS